ncbi:MAG: alpha/beta hydrolase [Beijerinckiaceae bacterium]
MTALVLLAGCAARSDQGLLTPVAEGDPAGKRVSVLVATTRLRGEDPHSLTNGRSHLVDFQRVDLSIPRSHQLGNVETPSKGRVDPRRDFAALRNESVSEKGFLALAGQAASRGNGEVNIYVHGFNTTYEAAVLRLGQIIVDAGTTGTAIAFSWPSRGRFVDYLTDRESALFSRDRLEYLLRILARQKDVRTINILSHSMGAFLTMETLRQAKLRGDGEFGGKLNAVVLAAPDIDLDVFRTQLEVIGRRKRPTILLVANDDRALNFARFLSGDVDRLGAVEIDSPEAQAEIRRLGLIVIDMTSVRSSDPDGHNKFSSNPAVIRYIGDLIDQKNVPATTLKINADGNIIASDSR